METSSTSASTSNPPAAPGGRGRPRRPWRRLLRAALAAALVLAVAYAALPWWAPTGLLGRMLQDQLTRQSGVPVTVGSLEIRFGGVEIRDLAFGDPDGNGPFLTLPALRAAMAPFDLLVRKRLAWTEVSRPRLRVRLDANGADNLEPLRRLPADVQVDRISLRDASVELLLPKAPRPICFTISTVELSAGKTLPVGKAIVSASLAQPSGAAPITLQFAEGRRDDPVAGSFSMTFNNLELGELALPEALSLPLSRLWGRCQGSLDIQLNRQLQFNRLNLNVIVANLDVQVPHGPPMGVIPRAQVRTWATFDLVSGKLQLETARAVLPGVDLSGQAAVILELADAANGSPAMRLTRLESLDLSGTIEPDRLSLMLGGTGELGGGYRTSGRIDLGALSIGPLGTNPDPHINPHLGDARLRGVPLRAIRLRADANELCIRRGQDILKPLGRTLAVSVGGLLEPNGPSWLGDFTGPEQSIALGDSSIKGQGTLLDLGKMLARLAEANRPSDLGRVLDELAAVEWRGSWRIGRLETIAEMLPQARDLFDRLHMEGGCRGDCTIGPGAPDANGTAFNAWALLDDGCRLDVENVFHKPPSEEMRVDLSGVLDHRGGLRDADVRLVVGQGRVSGYSGDLRRIDDANDDSPAVRASGEFRIERPELLLRYFGPAKSNEGILAHDGNELVAQRGPVLPGALRETSPAELPAAEAWRVEGVAGGTFALFVGDYRQRLDVGVDLKAAQFSLGRAFAKPAAQAGDLEIHVSRGQEANSPSEQDEHLGVTYHCPQGNASVSLEGPNLVTTARSPDANFRLVATADIKDAGAALAASATLADLAGGEPLAGPLTVRASAIQQDGQLRADIAFDANEMSYATPRFAPGQAGRKKSAGVALGGSLSVHLAGTLAALMGGGNSTGPLPLEVERASLRLGQSALDLSASGAIDLAGGARTHVPLARELAPLKGAVSGCLTFDQGLWDLLPELAPGRSPFGAGGTATYSGQAEFIAPAAGGEGRLALRGMLDANKLSVQNLLPLSGHWDPEGGQGEPNYLLLVKPAGLPAGARLDALLDLGTAELTLRRLGGQIGGLHFEAGGSVGLGQRPLATAVKSAQVFVWSQGLAWVPEVSGLLKPYQLDGNFRLEGRWRADPNRTPRWSGQFHAQGIKAVLKDRPVEVHGGLALGGEWSPQSSLTLQRLSCDALEFRAGPNHGWVMADLTGLPQRPAGSVRLLATYLDDKDLADWLAPAEANLPPRLGEANLAALRERAGEWIASANRALGEANLHFYCSIEKFKTFDAVVGQSYRVDHLDVEASVDSGTLDAGYVAGVSGGTLRRSCRARLGDPASALVVQGRIEDVQASENIRPQLLRFFPGNTLLGSFSRQEDLSAPLRDAVANLLDKRYPLYPAGTGKMIADDGIVEGKAAPDFVTRFFPGLNLAQYRYKKMTSFADYAPDGNAVNDMIFTGPSYDVYMEGTTDANNIARYKMGLLLLSSPQSAEWNHMWKAGRLPLLNIKARIEGGKLLDADISYPWPNEVLGTLLIEQNPLYRMWLMRKGK